MNLFIVFLIFMLFIAALCTIGECTEAEKKRNKKDFGLSMYEAIAKAERDYPELKGGLDARKAVADYELSKKNKL